DAFVKTLEDNADLRWNICTQADECIVRREGDVVFFLMCPRSMEENPAAGEDQTVTAGPEPSGVEDQPVTVDPETPAVP
ncbi:MAG TPA: hypothetical protein H9844_10810, partial [Candidatus Evtepia faecigallinarum]|nr:hypothetical protein [Candidatus Evtepia faecigallinarum]